MRLSMHRKGDVYRIVHARYTSSLLMTWSTSHYIDYKLIVMSPVVCNKQNRNFGRM